MTVKGIDKIRKNIGNVFIETQGVNTQAALSAIMMTARGHVMLRTPVDTATMINSLNFKVSKESAVLYFRGGFADKTGFNYALYLEENESWKPTKKPAAGPHFMRDGFESPEARADIMAVIKASYRL
jgi:hypothetical protein